MKDIRMNIAITGQRPQGIDNDFTYKSDTWQFIYRELEATFAKINPKKIYTGMALGVDTVAAEVAIKMQIPFVAAVPFSGQEFSWGPSQQKHYHDLLGFASSVVTIGTADQVPWIYQKRNEYMVDNADIVVAVWNGMKGGTRNCVEYALKQKQTVYRIDPKTHKVGRYDGTKHVGRVVEHVETLSV
jgi:uncharacterized phage-like protein YoqJ